MDSFEPLRKFIENYRLSRPLLVEIILALVRADVDSFISNPALRNGTVTLRVRLLNGGVAYVQPSVEAELKMPDKKAKLAAAQLKPN